MHDLFGEGSEMMGRVISMNLVALGSLTWIFECLYDCMRCTLSYKSEGAEDIKGNRNYFIVFMHKTVCVCVFSQHNRKCSKR